MTFEHLFLKVKIVELVFTHHRCDRNFKFVLWRKI